MPQRDPWRTIPCSPRQSSISAAAPFSGDRRAVLSPRALRAHAPRRFPHRLTFAVRVVVAAEQVDRRGGERSDEQRASLVEHVDEIDKSPRRVFILGPKRRHAVDSNQIESIEQSDVIRRAETRARTT